MHIEIDFKELEAKIVKEFAETNMRASKEIYPKEYVSVSARVAVLAIQKYHEAFHKSQPENQ